MCLCSRITSSIFFCCSWGDISTGRTAENPAISTNVTLFGVGPHFNPGGASTPHGCYPIVNRHVGDIGNIVVTGPEANEQTFTFTRDLLSLSNDGGMSSIIGRGVILHGGADDCITQPTGMSGGPWAQVRCHILAPLHAVCSFAHS